MVDGLAVESVRGVAHVEGIVCTEERGETFRSMDEMKSRATVHNNNGRVNCWSSRKTGEETLDGLKDGQDCPLLAI